MRISNINHSMLAFALAFGLSQGASGEVLSAHHQAAADYLEATNHRTRIGRIINQVRDQQIAALGNWYVPADTQGPAQQFVREASALIGEELSWDNLRAEFIEIYAAVYSTEELRGLAEFYRSELGRKYLQKRPKLIAQGLKITEQRLSKLLPKIERLSKALAREIAAQRGTGAQR